MSFHLSRVANSQVIHYSLFLLPEFIFSYMYVTQNFNQIDLLDKMNSLFYKVSYQISLWSPVLTSIRSTPLPETNFTINEHGSKLILEICFMRTYMGVNCLHFIFLLVLQRIKCIRLINLSSVFIKVNKAPQNGYSDLHSIYATYVLINIIIHISNIHIGHLELWLVSLSW